MKKILICLLLLANLTTGLAFALDTHPGGVSYESAAVELLTDADHDHPEGELHHSDHCGHGAAHLLGLLSNPTSPFMASRHDGFPALAQTPVLLYVAPLLRPPIV